MWVKRERLDVAQPVLRSDRLELTRRVLPPPSLEGADVVVQLGRRLGAIRLHGGAKLVRPLVPFLIAIVTVLLIVAFVPETVLMVPRLLGFVK